MTTPFLMVREFHKRFGLPAHDSPRLMTEREYTLFWNNFVSEWKEMHEGAEDFRNSLLLIGSHNNDSEYGVASAQAALDHLLKEACDVIYTTMAPFVALGIDFDEAFNRVHASNMAKDPALRDAMGKVLKPPGWKKPDLSDLVQVEQRKEAQTW